MADIPGVVKLAEILAVVLAFTVRHGACRVRQSALPKSVGHAPGLLAQSREFLLLFYQIG